MNKQGEQHIEQPVNNQRTQTRMYKKDKNIYSRFLKKGGRNIRIKMGRRMPKNISWPL